jgi:hypothetical protein
MDAAPWGVGGERTARRRPHRPLALLSAERPNLLPLTADLLLLTTHLGRHPGEAAVRRRLDAAGFAADAVPSCPFELMRTSSLSSGVEGKLV